MQNLYASILLQAVSLVMYPRGKSLPHKAFSHRQIFISINLELPFGLISKTLVCVSFVVEISPGYYYATIHSERWVTFRV
jgi:hypothetical protein